MFEFVSFLFEIVFTLWFIALPFLAGGIFLALFKRKVRYLIYGAIAAVAVPSVFIVIYLMFFFKLSLP